jgi:hypothetical protein
MKEKNKNDTNKVNKTKLILIIEVIFLFVIFAFLFFYTAPRQIYPLHGMIVSNPDFLFEIENSKEIALSTDMDFTNYINLKEGDEITLPPGIYFWKVKGIVVDSEVRNFTLESTVGLMLKEKGELYEVQNSGNVDLNLTKKQGTITLGEIVNVGESKEFEKDNSTYTGEQA